MRRMALTCERRCMEAATWLWVEMAEPGSKKGTLDLLHLWTSRFSHTHTSHHRQATWRALYSIIISWPSHVTLLSLSLSHTCITQPQAGHLESAVYGLHGRSRWVGRGGRDAQWGNENKIGPCKGGHLYCARPHWALLTAGSVPPRGRMRERCTDCATAMPLPMCAARLYRRMATPPHFVRKQQSAAAAQAEGRVEEAEARGAGLVSATCMDALFLCLLGSYECGEGLHPDQASADPQPTSKPAPPRYAGSPYACSCGGAAGSRGSPIH